MNQPELKTGEPGKFGGECAIRGGKGRIRIRQGNVQQRN